MGKKQMTKYDGVNTLANIADAAYQRKTAKALEEANLIAKKQTQLLEAQNRHERAEQARQAREAAEFAREQNRLINEGNRQRAALLKKEHLSKKLHREKIEQMQRKEFQRKEEITRRDQASRNKKNLLFEIHNDVNKSIANSTYSNLDKYIELCAALNNIEINKIDHNLTDDFTEKDVVQKMIDQVSNHHKTVRNSFSSQDEEDHDLLVKILTTNEELEIKKLEDEITKNKSEIVNAEEKIQKIIDSEIDNTRSEIDNINNEISNQEMQISMSKNTVLEIKKKSSELSNMMLSETISKFYNHKNNNLKNELVTYLKSKNNNFEINNSDFLKNLGTVIFEDN